MKVTAIILDGFHKGHVVHTAEYLPTIKLLRPKSVVIDYCCDGSEHELNPTADYVEYVACFHAVDKKVVLYSEEGKSMDFLTQFPHEVTSRPWSPKTYLKFGYHDEPVRRVDEDLVTPREI